MKTHRLHCQDPWFTFIENGRKRVEGRKNLPKYQSWSPGDVIVFYLEAREFNTVIKDMRHYKNLKDYLLTEGIDKVLPGINSLQDAMAVYLQWSTPKEIERDGFLAIEIELLRPIKRV